MSQKPIICIARQYGSGGHAIGEKLAQDLNLPFYDKDLIKLAARESGMSQEIFEEVDEKATNSLLYSLATGAYMMGSRFSAMPEISFNDKLFIMQANIIQEAAKKGQCVIVGRCADYVLQDKFPCVNIFIHSSLENRIKRIQTRHNLDEKTAKEQVIKMDKQRANYYNYYTDRKWGNIDGYHLIIDSCIGEENCVTIIKDFIHVFCS